MFGWTPAEATAPPARVSATAAAEAAPNTRRELTVGILSDGAGSAGRKVTTASPGATPTGVGTGRTPYSRRAGPRGHGRGRPGGGGDCRWWPISWGSG